MILAGCPTAPAAWAITATLVAAMGWIVWNIVHVERLHERNPSKSVRRHRVELVLLLIWFGFFAASFASDAILGHCWGTNLKPGTG